MAGPAYLHALTALQVPARPVPPQEAPSSSPIPSREAYTSRDAPCAARYRNRDPVNACPDKHATAPRRMRLPARPPPACDAHKRPSTDHQNCHGTSRVIQSWENLYSTNRIPKAVNEHLKTSRPTLLRIAKIPGFELLCDCEIHDCEKPTVCHSRLRDKTSCFYLRARATLKLTLVSQVGCSHTPGHRYHGTLTGMRSCCPNCHRG